MRACAIVLMFLSLMACEKQNDAEVRRFTQLQTEEEIQKEQQALNERVKGMEQSLKAQHEFYEDFTGVFVGSTISSQYKIKALVTVNHPLYKGDRVRTPAEVEEDLNTLGLNLQIQVYDPKFPSGAVGCRIENIEPDLTTLEATIIRENCPNSFKLVFNRGKLEGILYPSTSPEEMLFVAERRAQ